MSFLSKIFSRTKTIDDIFDSDKGLLAKVGGWIGNKNFTDEERAEMDKANVEAVQKFVIDTLSESTARSEARRDIAVFFMKFYAGMLFMCGMTYPIDPEWSAVWLALATSATVGGLVISISIFFFGSHALSKHSESKNKK